MSKKALNRIKKYQEYYSLTENETLYLVFKYFGISHHIPAEDLIELMNQGILDDDGEFVENLDTAGNSSVAKLKGNKPKYKSKTSKEVYKYLVSRLCYKDPHSSYPIAVNPDSITKKQKEALEKYRKESLAKIKKEDSFYGPYTVFQALFPTSLVNDGPNLNNTKWTAFFKVSYQGVNLRKRTISSGRSFMHVTKKTDMGVLLYAVYLFIRSGFRGDRTFIGSQTTFFKEWEDWYAQAEALIDQTENVEDLFKIKKGKGNHKGGTIL